MAESPADPSPQLVKELFSDGLLLLKPEDSAAALKLFIVVQSTEYVVSDASRVSDDLAKIVASISGLEDAASVYSGDGNLGGHIVRATAKSYGDAFRISDAVATEVARFSLRTTTLLVAKTGRYETDNINNIAALTGAEHRLGEMLNIDVELLALLDSDVRRRLEAVVEELVSRLGETSEWETVQGIVRACLTNDRRQLRQYLSFVLDFELYFREYVTLLLANAWGSAWPTLARRHFPELFRNLDQSVEQSPPDWPLGVVHSLLREAAAQDTTIKAEVLHDLGEQWSSRVRAVLNLRNPFAHGKLLADVPRRPDLSAEWGRDCFNLLRALPLYFVLYQSAERVHNDYTP